MRKGSKLSLRKQAAAGAAAKQLRVSRPAAPPRSPLNSAAGPVNAGAPTLSPGLKCAGKTEEAITLADVDALVQPGPKAPTDEVGNKAAEVDYEEHEGEGEDYAHGDEEEEEEDDDHDDEDDDDFDVPVEQQGGVKGLAERLASRTGASTRPTRSSSRSRRSSGVDLDAPISADVPEADLLRRQRNIAMMEANACVAAIHSAIARFC